MKRYLASFLALLLITTLVLSLAPVSLAQGSQTAVPVWKCAFVSLPYLIIDNKTIYLKDEDKTTPSQKDLFFAGAPKFENFIEDATHGAVDIQIKCFESDVTSNASYITELGIPGTNRNDVPLTKGELLDVYEKYELEKFDTVFFLAYLYLSPNHFDEIPSRTRNDFVQLNAGNTHLEYNVVMVHEFIHVLELWFASPGRLQYTLPVYYSPKSDPITGKIIDNIKHWYSADFPSFNFIIKDHAIPYTYNGDNSCHIPQYYQYSSSVSYYGDWLGGRVKDPKYGEEGHPFEYLGMAPAMWELAPTKTQLPIWPNGGGQPEDIIDPWDAFDWAETPSDGVYVPSDSSGTYIDLTSETLTTNLSIAAYSVDGGAKRKKVAKSH